MKTTTTNQESEPKPETPPERSHNYLPELLMAMCGLDPFCKECGQPLGLCNKNGCKPELRKHE